MVMFLSPHQHTAEFVCENPEQIPCARCQNPPLALLIKCQQCAQALCELCFAETHRSPRHPHPLIPTLHRDAVCDACYSNKGIGSYFYCHDCNYDECASCFRLAKTERCDEYKFWVACRDGREETVEAFIQKGVVNANWINPTDRLSPTGFWAACAKGHLDVVTKLIGLDTIDPNVTDHLGRSPFFMACLNQHPLVISMMLVVERGIDYGLRVASPGGGEAQTGWDVASDETVGLVKHILEVSLPLDGTIRILRKFAVRGEDQQQQQQQQQQPREPEPELDPSDPEVHFWNACQNGDLPKLRALLAKGICNKAWTHPSNRAPTGFWLACDIGRVEVVRFLVTHVDVDTARQNEQGRTPLVIAYIKDHPEVIQVLLESGRDLNMASFDQRGKCILYTESSSREGRLIADFLDKRPPDNLFERCSPEEKEGHFFRACEKTRLSLVQKLVGEGIANVDWVHPSNSAPTGFWIACELGRTAIVAFLVTLPQVDVAKRCSRGRTPLYIACANEEDKVVELLLASGRDLDLDAVADHKTAEQVAPDSIKALFSKHKKASPDYRQLAAEWERRCQDLHSDKQALEARLRETEARCQVLQRLDLDTPREYKDPRPSSSSSSSGITTTTTTLCVNGLGILRCPVCLETHREPRTLPCQHSGCLGCLQQLSPAQCPLCRLPFEAALLLPTSACSFYVLNATQNPAPEDPNSLVCSLCAGEEGEEARWMCRECGQAMCTQCRHIHDRISTNRGHAVVGLDDQAVDIQKSRPFVCTLHGQSIKFYCGICREAVCAECGVTHHFQHDLLSLEEGHRLVLDQLRASVESTQARQTHLQEHVGQLRGTLDELEANYTLAFNSTLTQFGKAGRLLRVREEMLLTLLDEVRDSRRKNLQLQLEHLEFAAQELGAVAEVAQQTIEQGTVGEVVQTSRQLLARMQTLLELALETEPLAKPHLDFFAKGEQEFEEVVAGLGKILNA